jgi:hypothetical protein
LTLEPLEGRALLSLTTWTVNSLGDSGAGTGTSGDLRYVITQADKTTGDNTINFAVTGTITLNSALPDLRNTTGVTDIEGPGANLLTVSGNNSVRPFTVDIGVTASLTGLNISGGSGGGYGGGIYNAGTLTVTNCTIDNSFADWDGGGIFSDGAMTVTNSTIDDNSTFNSGDGGGIYNGGTLTVTNSTIDDNSSSNGGGIYYEGTLTVASSSIYNNRGGYGGGINGSGALTVTNTSIYDNSAGFGAGMICGSGPVTVANSSIYDNSAPYDSGNGGGIYNVGTMTVTNSTIDNNSAWVGGGIYNPGTLTINNSTIADNSAGSFGGGGIDNWGTLTINNSTIADNSATNWGGGIDTWSGVLTVINSTIADNSAGSLGGGLDNRGGVLTVINSTIADNSAGTGGGLWANGLTTRLDNTLIALNTNGDVTLGNVGTVSSSSAYNLIGTGGSGGLVNGVNGNQVGVTDAGLDPNGLQFNGGPTQTIALVTGSPAIDAGSNALAVYPTTGQLLTTDQRGTGFPRIANGSVDIGAYEVQSYITAVAVGWGTQTATLQTASDGLRLLPAGRNMDMPWLGIDRIQITLTQPATLAASDITAIGSSGTNYGPVMVSGSGTSYTITLAQPINAADRVTITIGNDLIAPFTRRLDVLPGDVNDDGVVNVQDLVAIRNQMLGLLGAVPTIFGDINGDGKVDILDYTAVRMCIGTTLPRIT